MVAFAFAIVKALVMATTCRAQNMPQDYVNAHNKARAAVGVAGVSWDPTVQAYAQNYANQRKADCVFSHSMNRTYGKNIAWGSSKDYSGIDAVNLWVAEKVNYTYASNSCSAVPPYSCDHYKQVVWRTSTKISCARVVCDKNAGVFITCNYSPAGNQPGQKPY